MLNSAMSIAAMGLSFGALLVGIGVLTLARAYRGIAGERRPTFATAQLAAREPDPRSGYVRNLLGSRACGIGSLHGPAGPN